MFACKIRGHCMDTACNVHVVHALYTRVMLLSLGLVLYKNVSVTNIINPSSAVHMKARHWNKASLKSLGFTSH